MQLSGILGAIGGAIADAASALEDPPQKGARVVAVTANGEIEPGTARENVVESLAAAIREVEAAYQERFDRRPRLVELLAVFAFDLRPDNDGLHDLEIRGT